MFRFSLLKQNEKNADLADESLEVSLTGWFGGDEDDDEDVGLLACGFISFIIKSTFSLSKWYNFFVLIKLYFHDRIDEMIYKNKNVN